MTALQLMRAPRALFPFCLAALLVTAPGGHAALVVADDAPANSGNNDVSAAFGFYSPEMNQWEENERVREALQQKISVNFDGTPMRQALEDVVEEIGVRIELDEFNLRDEGITPADFTVPRMLRADSAPAATLIRSLLGPQVAGVGLDFIIRDGSVLITPANIAEESLATRLYDVRRLVALGYRLESVPPRDSQIDTGLELFFFGAPELGDDAADQSDSRELRIIGLDQQQRYPADQGADEDLVTAVRTEPITTLQQVIYDLTTGSWWEPDGIGGDITRVGDCLAIQQTERVHEEIARLLAGLIEAATRTESGDPILVRPAPTDPEYAALRKRVTVEVVDAPLVDVLDDLSQQVGIPVRVNIQTSDRLGLAEIPVDTEMATRILNTKVTLNVDDGVLAPMLTRVVDELHWNLRIEPGQIVIDAPQGEDQQVVAIYNVADFDESVRTALKQLVMYETFGWWRLIDGTGGALHVLSNGVMPILQTPRVHAEIALLLERLRGAGANEAFPNPADDEWTTRIYPIENADAIDWLVDAVQTFVRPETWDVRGGEAAIRGGGHTLIIRQTGAGHRDVARLLERIEWAHGYVREHLPSGSEEKEEAAHDD